MQGMPTTPTQCRRSAGTVASGGGCTRTVHTQEGEGGRVEQGQIRQRLDTPRPNEAWKRGKGGYEVARHKVR